MSRLHPLSVPYRAAETTTRLAWVLLIVSIGSTSAGLGVPAAAGLVLAALGLALAWQFARFERFDYNLTDDSFDIASGVLSRRVREIPLWRVQNVDIQRNVAQRALGLAEVRLETAGGSETEARLRYVGHEEARRLQRELGRRKRRTSAPESAEPETAERLFAITTAELVLLGFVSVDLRMLSFVSVLLSVFAPSLAGRFEDPLLGLATTAPLLAAGVVALVAVVGAGRSVTGYYGFELTRAGDELRYERGLLQQYSGTIPLEKVQTVTVEENALARLLGYASLTVETAGYAPGDAGTAQSAVPLADRARVLSLARAVEPFSEVRFERPPKRARLRYVVRYGLVVLALAGLAYTVAEFTRFAFAWYVVLGGLALVPVAAHLKWRNLGYAVLDDHVVTRSGFWTRTTTVVPYHRVQTVVTRASVFQRRRRLATLVVDTAGARSLTGADAAAVDIDAAVAEELREEIAANLQRALASRAARRRRFTDVAGTDESRGGATPG